LRREDKDLFKNSISLNVCLDARLQDGLSGGVQQFVIGLASGLGKLKDGDENYLFLSNPGSDQWLKEHLTDNSKIIYSTEPLPLRHKIEQIFKIIPFGSALLEKILKTMGNPVMKLPSSDGTIESLGADIMHFTHQSAFRTQVPSIYHPWDLQHLHFPAFFTEHQRSTRNYKYREFCNQAQIVPVASDLMKKELVRHFRLDDSKVKVIPMAAPVDAYPTPSNKDIEVTRRKFSFSESFLFYPAQTWPHKNHLVLLRALHILQKQHDIRPLLVCSGKTNDYFPTIRKELKKLKLTSQVKFIGFISPLELQCLYRLCRSVIFPSKYEGWGLPVTEALRIGVPLACSRLTILKEQTGDASLFFDPDKPQEIADTAYRLWTDAALREKLSAQGQRNAARFSWEKTARIFRAFYRLVSGKFYTKEDKLIVEDQQ
jgi:glycosyltransferase involved in cell wall biosynthesis